MNIYRIYIEYIYIEYIYIHMVGWNIDVGRLSWGSLSRYFVAVASWEQLPIIYKWGFRRHGWFGGIHSRYPKCKLVSCVCWLLKTSNLSVTIAVSPIDPTFNQAMFVKKAIVNGGLTLYVDIHTWHILPSDVEGLIYSWVLLTW